MSLPTFGEKVYYRRLTTEQGTRRNTLDCKWEEGCVLAYREDTTECPIGASKGVWRSSDVR
eukprot:3595954-Prorocentrum_lima.AAC.1